MSTAEIHDAEPRSRSVRRLRPQTSPYGDMSPRSVKGGVVRVVKTRTPATPASIITAWRNEGPIVHEPTAIATLDDVTGGGFVYGSRVYLVGAPDAGKTAACVQFADLFARRGIVVGMLAVDEDPADIVTRFAQRAGWKRRRLEERDFVDLDLVAEELAALPIRIYDATWTIDAAADDLAAEAARSRKRAALFIDSMQTATCKAENGTMSVREAVTARVQTVRALATRHVMLIVATSEMGRQAYRPLAGVEPNDMAAAKESGAIEYSARVLLALRSVAGEPDLVQLRVVKNKHGPSGAEIYLRLDRSRMTLTETVEPTAPNPAAEDVEKDMQRTMTDAARIALVLATQPGIGRRGLAAAVRAEHGSMSTDRLETGLAKLASSVVRRSGEKGGHCLYLDGARLTEPVLACLDSSQRATVARSTPPAEVDGAA